MLNESGELPATADVVDNKRGTAEPHDGRRVYATRFSAVLDTRRPARAPSRAGPGDAALCSTGGISPLQITRR
ncbi:MAG TPA: hypothetical protein VF621_05180, partial [Pyrinomonadaceae bacterium]